MKVLLRDHGLNLSGVKSDLYTGISAQISAIRYRGWLEASA